MGISWKDCGKFCKVHQLYVYLFAIGLRESLRSEVGLWGKYRSYGGEIKKAVEMIMNNEIICSSSIGAILKAERMKRI